VTPLSLAADNASGDLVEVLLKAGADAKTQVKDGETVVIGGLINDRYERTDKKIPLLGDIPILGMAFRQKAENTVKTELLIVLRPHVVRTPQRMKEITNETVDRMTLQPGLKDQIRDAQLKGMQGRFNEKGEYVNPIGAPAEDPAADGDARLRMGAALVLERGLHETDEQRVPAARIRRELGVELNTPEWQFLVTKPHDFALGRLRSDFKAIRKGIPAHKQAVITSRLKGIGKALEEIPGIMENRRGFSMHQTAGTDHFASVNLSHALVPQTDT
jgi:hypothetical protein